MQPHNLNPTPLHINLITTQHSQTDGKPLTSPSTNLEISAELAILAPNVHVRGQVLEFRAAATREWEAARV